MLIPSSSAARCTASRVRISATHRNARERRAPPLARAEPRTITSLDASPVNETDAREATDAREGAMLARSISSASASDASRRRLGLARGASSDADKQCFLFFTKLPRCA